MTPQRQRIGRLLDRMLTPALALVGRLWGRPGEPLLNALTGRDKGGERAAKLAALAKGDIQVLVGTHAVFQADVVFEDLRLAVVDASDTRGQAVRMANPEVLHASAQMREHSEGSPNLPGVRAKIARPRAVTVRFMNADGVWDRQEFVGLWATSVQHQIDHLNGRMFFDHLSRVKRDMLLKKARKLRPA